MYHQRTKDMIKEVAKNEGTTAAEATEVVETMFEALRFFMSNPDNRKNNHFPIIKIPGFATFRPAIKYMEYFKEINKEKYKDESV